MKSQKGDIGQIFSNDVDGKTLWKRIRNNGLLDSPPGVCQSLDVDTTDLNRMFVSNQLVDPFPILDVVFPNHEGENFFRSITLEEMYQAFSLIKSTTKVL